MAVSRLDPPEHVVCALEPGQGVLPMLGFQLVEGVDAVDEVTDDLHLRAHGSNLSQPTDKLARERATLPTADQAAAEPLAPRPLPLNPAVLVRAGRTR